MQAAFTHQRHVIWRTGVSPWYGAAGLRRTAKGPCQVGKRDTARQAWYHVVSSKNTWLPPADAE